MAQSAVSWVTTRQPPPCCEPGSKKKEEELVWGGAGPGRWQGPCRWIVGHGSGQHRGCGQGQREGTRGKQVGRPDGPEKRPDFGNVTEVGTCPVGDPSLHRVFQGR